MKGTAWLAAAMLSVTGAVPAAAPGEPDIRAICKRVADRRPPASDEPTATQAAALKGCDAELLYYGGGVPRDPVKAKFCALTDGSGSERVLGDNAILMQLYANGLGMKRDLDIATAYACDYDGAQAEAQGRVAHLDAMRRRPGGTFDICDDITSGLGAGYCAVRDARIAAFARDRRIAPQVRLPAAARAAYPALRRTLDAFVAAHEVDRSGSDRAAALTKAQEAVRDQFVVDLARLADGRWPRASAADARAADAALNRTYRVALIRAASPDNPSTVTAAEVRDAQRAWLAYRDAFVRVAAAVAGVDRDAVVGRLSRLPAAQLHGDWDGLSLAPTTLPWSARRRAA